MDKRNIKWDIVFWLLITAITFGVSVGLMPMRKAIVFSVVSFIFYAFAFYMNTLVLFPKYYGVGRNVKYTLFVAILLIITTWVMAVLEYKIVGPISSAPEHSANPKTLVFARGALWLLLLLVVGTIYLIQKRLKEQQVLHQENKLKTELKLLRSQINPHFLFNSLNNIYSLSYMKSDKAPESILKLSSMLRYVIEDCTSDKVSMKSEIEYIQNYIDFQNMKSPDDMNVTFDHKQLNYAIPIAPMLFITFLENSYKYSNIEDLKDASIDISIKSDQDGNLKLTISNSVPETAKITSGAGTGIKNVKQRLRIIYPNKHRLRINESDNSYKVNLTIETNEDNMYSD